MPQQLRVEVCADPLYALQRLREARFDAGAAAGEAGEGGMNCSVNNLNLSVQ